MDLEYCCKNLADNAQRIRIMTEGCTADQARWRPDPDSWSILEVINHLLDEEKLDFRIRLDITLHRPSEKWPAINPALWVTERRYNEKEMEESMRGFLAARDDSIAWLMSLQSPSWEAAYEAPWGRMKAGDLMASWVVHDLLHMRQLVELQWAYLSQRVRPYHTIYAGEW